MKTGVINETHVANVDSLQISIKLIHVPAYISYIDQYGQTYGGFLK